MGYKNKIKLSNLKNAMTINDNCHNVQEIQPE